MQSWSCWLLVIKLEADLQLTYARAVESSGNLAPASLLTLASDWILRTIMMIHLQLSSWLAFCPWSYHQHNQHLRGALLAKVGSNFNKYEGCKLFQHWSLTAPAVTVKADGIAEWQHLSFLLYPRILLLWFVRVKRDVKVGKMSGIEWLDKSGEDRRLKWSLACKVLQRTKWSLLTPRRQRA